MTNAFTGSQPGADGRPSSALNPGYYDSRGDCITIRYDMSTSNSTYQALLNRAEMLANSIGLGDAQDIEYQTARLRALLISDQPPASLSQLFAILEQIGEQRYSEALTSLSQLLDSSKAVTAWRDPLIRSLRAEIRLLCDEIQDLEEQKQSILKRIREFDCRYNAELGELIIAILDVKAQLAARAAQNDPENVGKQEAHRRSEQDYRDFGNQYAERRKTPTRSLTKEEQDELKQLFRRASKLCHPDLVDPGRIKEAAAIFRDLVDAYDSNDLASVRAILSALEAPGSPAAGLELPTEREKLNEEVLRLRQVRAALAAEIDELRNSETFRTIAQIPSWDDHFTTLRRQLENELQRLRGQAEPERQ